jgi:hypothetical protein
MPFKRRLYHSSNVFPEARQYPSWEWEEARRGAFVLLNFDTFTSSRRGHVLENEEPLSSLRTCQLNHTTLAPGPCSSVDQAKYLLLSNHLAVKPPSNDMRTQLSPHHACPALMGWETDISDQYRALA